MCHSQTDLSGQEQVRTVTVLIEQLPVLILKVDPQDQPPDVVQQSGKEGLRFSVAFPSVRSKALRTEALTAIFLMVLVPNRPTACSIVPIFFGRP